MAQVECPSCEDVRQVGGKLQGLDLDLTCTDECTDGYPLAFFRGNTHRIDLPKWLMFPGAPKEGEATSCSWERRASVLLTPGGVPLCLLALSRACHSFWSETARDVPLF